MAKPIVLIVEDDTDLREALVDTLEGSDFTAVAVDGADAALRTLAVQHVDLVCSDVNMPGINGMQLLTRIRHEFPAIPVVLMTAYGSIEHSVRAMHQGAADYLVKPFKSEVFLETLEKYLNRQSRIQSDLPVAEEPSSRRLLQLAHRVAGSDATVLITGESGTGKEVLARYIHTQSKRVDGPFIAINCAAIPESMLEATLFGYEKGAFTGAYTAREGKFEQAEGGTILLDEISEMDTGLQAKILRVLQEREVERLGGKSMIRLNVRVIATSNRNLKQCVADGSFREDLFYRLSVFPLEWQPLRERRGDILPIAQRLLASHCKKMGRQPVRLDGSAEYVLRNYDWPGNVRELDNTIQRALVMQDSAIITASNLALDPQMEADPYASITPDAFLETNQKVESYSETHGASGLIDPGLLDSDLKQREYEVILSTLRKNRGQRKRTAQVLGISARTLRYKIARMREIGINIEAMIEV